MRMKAAAAGYVGAFCMHLKQRQVSGRRLCLALTTLRKRRKSKRKSLLQNCPLTRYAYVVVAFPRGARESILTQVSDVKAG